MPELRRPALRLALGLALVAALLVEVRTLVQSLNAHQRQQARATERLRQGLVGLRGRVAEGLRPGGEAARAEALRAAAAGLPGATLELYDTRGARLLAQGGSVPVAHWVDVETLTAAGPEGVYVVGPFPGNEPYLLAYALFETGSGAVVLRAALRADELRADLEERREVLLAHALSLALVLLVAVLALSGARAAAPEEQPSRHALGAYEAAMGHLRDREQRLSEEHAAERLRLERAVREKEALARAGELTTGLAHEVRNGLGTIAGYARLLERSGLPGDGQAAAAAIRAECETLEKVVRRFVEYVRPDELKLGRFELRRTLERVAARETRGRPGAEVALLPGEPLELAGDEELLERAFENVVRNGREAAGARGRVEIEVRRAGALAEVSVSDDGGGLGPEGTAGLRPFRSSKPGGLGLGLPLSSKIVRLHGGELRLGPRSPRGLEVLIQVPLAGAEPPADVTTSNAGLGSGSTGEPGETT